MSEIKKMYENAGIEKEYTYNVEQVGKGNVKLLECNKNAILALFPEFNKKNYKVVKVDKFKPFTAEKQIELIKWLFTISDISNINIEYENKKICIHNILGQSDDCDTIEDALASYINDIWQDLTEQERTEIAEILRG